MNPRRLLLELFDAALRAGNGREVVARALRGHGGAVTVFAIGKSILQLGSMTDVGKLCLDYGGGGHFAAGTCQVDTERADTVLTELIERITTDG